MGPGGVGLVLGAPGPVEGGARGGTRHNPPRRASRSSAAAAAAGKRPASSSEPPEGGPSSSGRKARRTSTAIGRGGGREEEGAKRNTNGGVSNGYAEEREDEPTQEELEAREVERKRVQAQDQGPDRPFKCDQCAQSFVSVLRLFVSRELPSSEQSLPTEHFRRMELTRFSCV